MQTQSPSNQSHPATGFTLIELLVVIGILSVLAVALLPNVLGAAKEGDIAATRARIEFLKSSAAAFERKNGYYPPDDFQDPRGKVKVKADSINPGIESLVVFLCQKRLGRDSLADQPNWLDNTDGDNAGATIPVLDTTEKMEVLDAWGMPLAYFCSMGDGYSRKQSIRGPEGDTATARAMRNPKTGKSLAAGKFQLISAGPDGEFGSDDDVTYPERPLP